MVLILEVVYPLVKVQQVVYLVVLFLDVIFIVLLGQEFDCLVHGVG